MLKTKIFLSIMILLLICGCGKEKKNNSDKKENNKIIYVDIINQKSSEINKLIKESSSKLFHLLRKSDIISDDNYTYYITNIGLMIDNLKNTKNIKINEFVFQNENDTFITSNEENIVFKPTNELSNDITYENQGEYYMLYFNIIKQQPKVSFEEEELLKNTVLKDIAQFNESVKLTLRVTTTNNTIYYLPIVFDLKSLNLLRYDKINQEISIHFDKGINFHIQHN